MAITSSAKKAIRVATRRSVFNARRIDAVRTVTKDLKKLVGGGKFAEAKALLPKAYAVIDKAAKMHTFHKNTAARKKSQLAKLTAVKK